MAQKTTSTDQIAAIKDLLMWARKERIVLSQVHIGEVSVVVTVDRKLLTGDADDTAAAGAERRQTILEEYGGALFNPPATGDGESNEPTVEDEDDE